MNQTVFIVIGIIVFLIVCFFIVLFLVKSSKKKQTISVKKTTKSKAKIASIDDYIKAASEAKTAAELSKIIMAFLQTQSFDKKEGSLSESMKKKLSFITAVSLNKYADAKNISFLNIELGKRYPEYKREIDLYENMGLAKRRMK